MKQWIYAVYINSPTHRTDLLGLAQTGFIVKCYPDCPRAWIYCMKLLLVVNWNCGDFQSTCIFIFNEALMRTRLCPEPYSWTLFLRCSLCISMTVSGFLHLLVQTCNLRSLSSAHAHSLTVVCGFICDHQFNFTHILQKHLKSKMSPNIICFFC